MPLSPPRTGLFTTRSSLLALAIAGSALLPACSKASDTSATADPAKATPSADARKPINVRFVRPEPKLLPQTIELSGSLAADETSEVASPVAGVVTKVNVDVGTRVKKGDVLVQLDPRDAALRAAQANAAAEQARARLDLTPGAKFDPTATPEVRSAKEALDLAVADAQRTKALFDGGSVSQASWDQARTRAEQAKAQYDAAVSGAKQSWAALSAAQASAGLSAKQLGDAAIRAPFDGSVAERRLTVGEFAGVGRVAAVVVRDNPLRLKLDVSESDISRVEIGKKVRLWVAAFPDRMFDGEVKRIGASLKTTSRTLPIEAEVPNAEGVLRPGLFARAFVALPGGDTKALMLPEAAVGTTGANSRVFVRQGDKVVERLVKVGRSSPGQLEVIGPLTDQDEVALTEVEKLSDGAPVVAVK